MPRFKTSVEEDVEELLLDAARDRTIGRRPRNSEELIRRLLTMIDPCSFIERRRPALYRRLERAAAAAVYDQAWRHCGVGGGYGRR